VADKQFKFYQVDNGQSVRITLDETTHLLFDLKQRTEDEEKTADVHSDLLSVCPKRDGRRWLSVFCLSHADRDHCQGFDRVFYVPNGEDDDKLVGIDELWVTAQIFQDDLDGPAKSVQKEARRRLKLWSDSKKRKEAEQRGNRLVVFGKFDDLKELESLPDSQHPKAGETVTQICGEARSDFEMFVHCPFEFILEESGETERNDTCLIGQIVLTNGTGKSRLLIGGDASCWVWKHVYNLTKKHKNLDRLDWDIFFIPHHGTYGFFTEKPGEDGRKEAEKSPAKTSMAILDHGQSKGWLVCSSRPVKEGNYKDDNPPHIEAIRHYRKRATDIEGTFVCLMENPSESAPAPLVLRVTANGTQRVESKASISVGTSAAAATTTRWG
jgi:hypothetical protein